MDARELEFEVAIDFLRGAGDASRIFRAMGGIVEALQSLDRHLIQMIDGGLSASVLLDDVSSGSIRAFMRSMISELPHEALEKADWRGLLGHFLVKAKYLILAWCDAKVDVITRSDVEKLTRLIDQEAVNTQVKAIPAYAGIRVADVLRDIQAIQQSVAVLDEQDKVVFRSVYGVVRLKSRVDVSPELVREVLTRNVVTSNSITLIRVKKPDYLGRSQWSFQYAGHRIDASIRDREWLGRFQARLEDVRPGDSLRVDLAQEIYYGYEGEVVHQQYAIDHVIEVVRPEAWTQADAFDDE